jgi:hypothetical protein
MIALCIGRDNFMAEVIALPIQQFALPHYAYGKGATSCDHSRTS